MSARHQRAAAAVGAVLVLLAVVGASAGHPLGGGAAAPTLPVWPLLVVIGAGLVLAGAVLVSLRPRVRLLGGAPERAVPVRAGPLTLGLALLVPLAVFVVYASPGTSGRHATVPTPPSLATHGPRQPKPTHPGKDQGSAAAALAAGIAAGLVGVAAVAVVRARRRAGAGPVTPRAAVAAGARDAMAAAAIPADPRAAVLAAYARMEAALASVGLGRRASEAPREYLSRLDAALGGGRAPAARLTGLFERARFSTHPIGEDVRRDALGALDDLRGELEGAA
jgi:hypothetical protein